jgi:hypothetical protein
MTKDVTKLFTYEDEEIYHEQSKSGKVLSSHMLMDFINSPKLYHKKTIGAIAERSRSAFVFGSAAHKLILEGRDAFDKEYVVSDGPINEKTGQPYGSTTKAYLEWKYAQDREIISIADYGELAKLSAGVQNNNNAKELLSFGVAEAVVRTDYCDISCQIRMDWFNPEKGIVDLKTCADLRSFENDAKKFNYIRQMAFYQQILKQVTGELFPVFLIAIEKQEPYACGVWSITQGALDCYTKSNERYIERLKECIANSAWPTGYEEIRVLGE